MDDSRKAEFDDCVEEYLREVDGERVKAGPESTVSRHDYFLLPDGPPIHRYSLDELRYFSKSLISLSVRSHTTPLSLDYLSYWAWVGANVSHHMMTLGNISDYQDIQNRYFSVVHSCLGADRHAIATSSDLYLELRRLNPSTEGLLHAGWAFVSTVGFSILEGLLKRRCDSLDIDMEVNINNAMKEWMRDEELEPITSEVLHGLDPLLAHMDTLEQKMYGFSAEDVDTFRDLIQEIRNSNIHAEESTRALGPIVATLCSLVILDSLDSGAYSEEKDELIEGIQWRRQNGTAGHHNTPGSLYPVHPLQVPEK